MAVPYIPLMKAVVELAAYLDAADDAGVSDDIRGEIALALSITRCSGI